ncbi:cytochrome c peroxidase [Zoogloea sp.]|uniref:cytochrome-c peroxidase n=1 Tax=Zoogloea sp. TaxID=49181 RepID=UPI0025F5827C|nr:cytochrome c peroxidase [Zoogloea sp.]MCK6395420.1 c-type cytochrome [Zoogloea sp.]
MRRLAHAACTLLLLSLAACGGGGGGSAPSSGMSAAAQVGESLFNDPILSSTGAMSCASCHDKANHHAAPDTRSVPAGANSGHEAGRQAPSLQYLKFNTAFAFAGDGTPTGGFTWDGRATSLADQASGPLLNPDEMANTSIDDVVAKLKRSTHAAAFRKVFGDDILERPADAFARLQFALQQYQIEDPDFAPFSSKFDLWQAGKAQLSSAELKGWSLFNDPNKGNCAACHVSTPVGGNRPLFTDNTFDNLGVPRNPEIKANADSNHYDLGLCGPTRTDLSGRTDLCGAFRVPSLRNVAKTAPYFHNGAIKTLTDAVRFYVRRDTNPEEWYPTDANGVVLKFNDLPLAYHANVNVTEAPYNRKPGDAPALNESEIADLVSFLNTLTDGYTP